MSTFVLVLSRIANIAIVIRLLFMFNQSVDQSDYAIASKQALAVILIWIYIICSVGSDDKRNPSPS